MDKNTALIAMSGGVDSTVAAWLTLQEGFSCMGATMTLFDSGCGAGAVEDARAAAEKLQIPFRVYGLESDFAKEVIDDFVTCYESGLTPNPCIRCNRALKFGRLLELAAEAGCHHIVTGHYAQVRQDPETGRYLLCKGLDAGKDQSYFLYALTQDQISRIRFPLGSLSKDQVRVIAEAQGFSNAKKKDSQDICFIPDGDYGAFLRRYTGKTYPQGAFLDQEGKKVGTHSGVVNYTLGQRKGLGLAMGAPVYVCGKDMAANTVTVGPNEALFSKELVAGDWFFFPFETLTQPLEVTAKVRSRMEAQPATVYPLENGLCRVVFREPQRAITPGQAVVLYDGDVVVGGGTILQA